MGLSLERAHGITWRHARQLHLDQGWATLKDVYLPEGERRSELCARRLIVKVSLFQSVPTITTEDRISRYGTLSPRLKSHRHRRTSSTGHCAPYYSWMLREKKKGLQKRKGCERASQCLCSMRISAARPPATLLRTKRYCLCSQGAHSKDQFVGSTFSPILHT